MAPDPDLDYGDGLPHRASALGVLVVFVLATVGTLLLDTLLPAPPPRLLLSERTELETKAARASLWDGTLMRLWEDELRLSSRVALLVSGPYATFLYDRLGEVSKHVVHGEDGWLFLAERLWPPARSDAQLAGLAGAAVAALERRTAERGLPLIAVPVPRKSVIEREHLPAGLDPRPDLDRAVVEACAERGVSTVDLAPSFSVTDQLLFYPYDTHWTPSAELLAAGEMVRHAGLTIPDRQRQTAIHFRNGRTPPGRLDILSYMDVQLRGDSLKAVRNQDIANYKVEMRRRAGPEFPPELTVSRNEGRLVISGTSYSDSPNFARYLSHYSQQSVLNGALSGVAFGSQLRELLLRPQRLQSATTLFFEFPIHQVFFPEDETGRCVLPEPLGMLFGEHPLPNALPLSPIWELELEDSFRGGQSVRLPARRDSLVAQLARSALFHTGDGVVGLRIVGEVTGPSVVLELEQDGTRLRAPWPVGAKSLDLPLLAEHSGASRVRLFARGNGGVRLIVERVEPVLEALGGRIRTAVLEPGEAPEGEWQLHTELRRPLVPQRFAALFLRPATTFHGELSEVLVTPEDPDLAPLSLEVRGAVRSSYVVLSLARLAGTPIASIELRGSGELPEVGTSGRALIVVD